MKLNQKQLRNIIRESLQGLLMEGPGAGYYVSMRGLNATNIHMTGLEENEHGEELIDFKAELAPSKVTWKAEGYYDVVTSDGIYYDGDMVDEFGDEERSVQGGTITGYVYKDDVEDYANGGDINETLTNFVGEILSNFSFQTLVGAGYVHTNLTDPLDFENIEVSTRNPYYGYGTVYIQNMEIQAPDITNIINWFFENCYKFDEIYGNKGEELNESINNQSITAQDLEDCFTNEEICDLLEKVLGVDSVNTQGDWEQYLYILADKLNEKGIAFEELDAMLEPAEEGVLTEQQIRRNVRKTLNELDWKTYANASKKAHQWRQEHPWKYDRNRGLNFDIAAQDAFRKQHDIHNQDVANYGGEKGNINMSTYHGVPEITGSRNHDFKDKENPFNLKHNVYHMGKRYGKDGNYGRARMWDFAHETTPEEFYDDPEMAKKFRDAEKDVEDYNNDNYAYSTEKGWHLKENAVRKIVRESLRRLVNETSYDFANNALKANGDKIDNAVRNNADKAEMKRLQKRHHDLFGHLKDRAGQRFDPEMPVVVVDEHEVRAFKAGELKDHFEITGICEPSENPIYNDSKCIGYPTLKDYCGPMWDGCRIRYESWPVYDELSR